MEGMFHNCYSLKYLNLGNFNAQNVISFSDTFFNCKSLTSLILPFYKDFEAAKLTSTSFMFYNCANLTYINFDRLNLTNVKYMNSMFKSCTSLKELIIACYNISGYRRILTTLISHNSIKYDLNPKSVINLEKDFYGCTSLISLDISNWNLGNVNNMKNTFAYC